MLDRYPAQVRPLFTVLPEIARETAFALNRGTAINLFYRHLPSCPSERSATWAHAHGTSTDRDAATADSLGRLRAL